MLQGSEGTVMVVDDDPLVLQSLSIMLKACGFLVTAYNEGSKALAEFPKIRPDVVVSDMQMPGISGLKLMEKLRSMDRDTPVIFITGNVEVEDVISALRMRAFDLLLKPFSTPMLVTALKKAICNRLAPCR